MRRALGVAIAALLAVAVVALAANRPVSVTEDEVDRDRSATTAASGTVVVPRAGQTIVRGVITAVDAEGARPAPLDLPLQLTVERGAGGARIQGVEVDGRRVTLVWDGGRPLDLGGGDGALDVGQARLELRAGGATWFLDGAARRLEVGRYRTAATVAVGSEGLAEPRDGVEFRATSGASIETHGGVLVATTPPVLHVEGPGSLVIVGQLEVVTIDATRSATRVRSQPGPFVLDARREGGAYRIEATVQAPAEVA